LKRGKGTDSDLSVYGSRDLGYVTKDAYKEGKKKPYK